MRLLLALSLLLSACTSSKDPAPSPDEPPVTEAAPAPKEVVVPAGRDRAIDRSPEPVKDQSNSTPTIGHSCPDGRCQQTCKSGQKCAFECAGGGCLQSCQRGAACQLACAGGKCKQTCEPGATHCKRSCLGQGCTPKG